MNKFELSSAFLIGHDDIDSDHDELVIILNKMVDSYSEQNTKHCHEIWQQFCARLEQHFAKETKIMSDFGYHEEGQTSDHQRILSHLEHLGGAENSLYDWEVCLFEMRNELLAWILRHDLKFSEYLITVGYNEARP
ncbi:MAG: hypothetical protein L3J50_13250 [Emcibacter sp.]|nr:hypothetical protein [Emcibacter sp.]